MMIVNKTVSKSLFQKCLIAVTKCQTANIHNRSLIGNRDWVGFGNNGRAVYSDELTFPCPAIRFKENTNELLALREKEKGDWRKLSIEEKKILYRASFRQTLIETLAPTGQWKAILGWFLILVSINTWVFFFEKHYVLPPLPETFSDEHRRKTLRRMLDIKHGHISGVSSRWDYEKDDWK